MLKPVMLEFCLWLTLVPWKVPQPTWFLCRGMAPRVWLRRFPSSAMFKTSWNISCTSSSDSVVPYLQKYDCFQVNSSVCRDMRRQIHNGKAGWPQNFCSLLHSEKNIVENFTLCAVGGKHRLLPVVSPVERWTGHLRRRLDVFILVGSLETWVSYSGVSFHSSRFHFMYRDILIQWRSTVVVWRLQVDNELFCSPHSGVRWCHQRYNSCKSKTWSWHSMPLCCLPFRTEKLYLVYIYFCRKPVCPHGLFVPAL